MKLTIFIFSYIFIALYTQRLANLYNRYQKKNAKNKGKNVYCSDMLNTDGTFDIDCAEGGWPCIVRWIPVLQIIPLFVIFLMYLYHKIVFMANSASIIYIAGQKIHLGEILKKIHLWYKFED